MCPQPSENEYIDNAIMQLKTSSQPILMNFRKFKMECRTIFETGGINNDFPKAAVKVSHRIQSGLIDDFIST